MALLKSIKQNNGIILNYHRIKDIQEIINQGIVLNIASYIDEEEREKEKKAYGTPEMLMVYIVNSKEEYPGTIVPTPKEAYDFLKTTEKYKDAIDI